MNESKVSRQLQQKLVKASCVPDPGSMTAGDALEKCIDPCILVILGATGDLSARKLIPVLFNLYLMERLPDPFSIVGCGRTAMDDEQFRTNMAEVLKDSDPSSSEKRTEISIQFKPVPYSLFRNILGETIIANRLVIGIYPDERIALTFQTKTPGAQVSLRSVTMDFHYHQQPLEQPLEAYEKVLLDCLLGDHMLFWRQDGVETCWAFLTQILSACENCGDRATMLHFYKSGSWGPQATENII